MTVVRDTMVRVWEKLNPVDPGPAYLAKFMGFAILVFAAGIAIGAMAS